MDVVASVGVGSERLNVRVGDRLIRAGVTVGALIGHGSRRLRLNLARMGIAWIASWVFWTVGRTTTSRRLAALARCN
jgi:hypothetical protein